MLQIQRDILNRTLAILRYSYIMSFGAIKRLVDSGLLQLSVLQAIHSSYVEESSRVERGQEVRACSGAKKMYFITHFHTLWLNTLFCCYHVQNCNGGT